MPQRPLRAKSLLNTSRYYGNDSARPPTPIKRTAQRAVLRTAILISIGMAHADVAIIAGVAGGVLWLIS